MDLYNYVPIQVEVDINSARNIFFKYNNSNESLKFTWIR